MAGDRIRLEVSSRETRGSAESRRLRRRGVIPGILYGKGEPTAFCVPERELRRALSGPSGLHAILDVAFAADGGGTHSAILKDYQQDPVRGHLLHIDLHEVRLDQPITATVNVALVGEAPGANEGGVLSQVTRELNISALPGSIPESIEADVGSMGVGDTLRLADLPDVEGIEFLDDPEETVLATVTAPTRSIEEEEAAEEAAAEAGGAPEGEQAPESASERPGDARGDAAGDPGTTSG